ncbi:MAG: diacylglycerol/polyprenol kinase family protein [Candidatus Hermodarchaeota archaeon]
MKILPVELSLIQDIIVIIISFIISILFFYFTDWIKKKEIASQYFTRKLIHLALAPIFLFTFLFYSGEWFSPWIAVIIPIIYFIAILLINFDIIKLSQLTTTMSRSGDPRELLRGIAYYLVVVIVVCIIGWTSYPLMTWYSPLSIFVITILAIGDGFADIIGRKVDRLKFRIFADKSIPGSLAMFFSSLAGCLAFLAVFGYNVLTMTFLTVLIVLIATIVEAFSLGDLDNITVPLSTLIAFLILSPILVPSAEWSLLSLPLP